MQKWLIYFKNKSKWYDKVLMRPIFTHCINALCITSYALCIIFGTYLIHRFKQPNAVLSAQNC